MGKALESGADAVIFDLEDSVPLAAKAEARVLVAKSVDGRRASGSGPADIRADQCAATGMLAGRSRRRRSPGTRRDNHGESRVRRRGAETPRRSWTGWSRARRCHRDRSRSFCRSKARSGVYRCYDLVTASPRVVGSLLRHRAGRRPADRSRHALVDRRHGDCLRRSKVLLDTRAAGKTCIRSTASSAISATRQGLIQDSRLSARLGYVGRAVIHPKQIAPVRRAYAVPEQEIIYYTARGDRVRSGGEDRRGGGHSRGRQAGGLRDVPAGEAGAGAGEA